MSFLFLSFSLFLFCLNATKLQCTLHILYHYISEEIMHEAIWFDIVPCSSCQTPGFSLSQCCSREHRRKQKGHGTYIIKSKSISRLPCAPCLHWKTHKVKLTYIVNFMWNRSSQYYMHQLHNKILTSNIIVGNYDLDEYAIKWIIYRL